MEDFKSKKFEIKKTFSFESAHLLPNVPKGHKCGRLHGHSFKATIIVRGLLDQKKGWVMDFAEISDIVKPLINQLDHHYLNEIPGLENPTAEVLAYWIYSEVKDRCPLLHRVVIHETCTSEASFPT